MVYLNVRIEKEGMNREVLLRDMGCGDGGEQTDVEYSLVDKI